MLSDSVQRAMAMTTYRAVLAGERADRATMMMIADEHEDD